MSFWIVLQVVCGLTTAALWWLSIAPGLAVIEYRRLVTDVWGPLALVVPGLFAVGLMGLSAAPVGHAIMTVPIVSAGLAIGFGLTVLAGCRFHLDWPTLAAWTACAVVLMLLAALNVLSVWVGQTIFATAIVLMWCHTPATSGTRGTDGPPADVRAIRSGLSMVAALLVGSVHGLALVKAGSQALLIGVTILSLTLTAALLAVVMRGSGSIRGVSRENHGTETAGDGSDAMRLACSTAILGPLLGIGVLSLVRMLPQAWQIARAAPGDEPDPPQLYLVFGLGVYAAEFALMFIIVAVAGIVAMGSVGMQARFTRMAGVAVLVASLLVITWRALAVLGPG